ncbi:beta strand repeat-containing protein, partial [Hymenobacter rubidus]|uniref:beta strand repeat-containing protein n=1 Tax=Hymenobacter rubidus TaxID=1441626 RepID=UPI00191FD7A7
MHKPLLANRLSRWLVVALLTLLSNSIAWAQSTANYAFTTSSTGSLVDMSSGTTSALATGTYYDDVASTVQPLGFTFVFMGTPYTQFSVNSNGQLRLGATAISGTAVAPTSGAAILAPFGGDNAVLATGKVHYKVVAGTNRTLVIEWNALRIPYGSTGTGSLVQAILEENTGKVEYRYGAMYNNSTSTVRSIFISAGTSAGQIGLVKTFTTTPTYDATVTSATTTTLPDNAVVPVLNSTADGARTVFTFMPTTVAPAAPTVTFTALTQTSLTVNILDNSTNEFTFAVYRSTDNVTFTLVGTVATTSTTGTGSTVTLAQTGLAPNTPYYYRVTANSEGVPSTAATATATTLVSVLCGTKSVGPSAGADYPTLTAAFTAINNNGLCGPLVLELQAAYVSTTETFPLVYNYTGATATNTVTVRPAAGANNLSITGTTAVAVMSITGGKYLIIDGRPGGSGATVSGAAQATDLTISSTSTSGIPLQFTSDATFNTVQHVQVKGVGTSDSGSPDVNFTGTVTTTGNSDNTVQYCNIGDGATTPVTLIYGGNALNARNSILNNNLFNNYYASGSTYGIYLNQSGAGWTISGNSLYQTASRAGVSGTMYGIFINANNGHTVSGNFIGGSAPSLGGTPLTITGTATTYRYAGIYLVTTTGTATNVQGNTVGNITWLSSSGASTTYGILSGIYVSTGDVNVGTTTGNVIGGATAPISVSATTTGGYAFGISTASSGAINISGNTISTITGIGASAIAVNVTGILASTGSPTISRNKIYNLAAGSAAGGTVATLANGIWLTGGTTTSVLNNLIGDLRAATSTSLVGVSGIQISGGTTHNLYYNTIYLTAASSGATFGTSGIYLNSTSATLDARNNIVVNKSTAAGTGGYTAALRRVSGTAGTAPANLATTTNNNLYYAGTPSATNLIYVEGTTTATNAAQTLVAYKSLVAPRESNSVTEDVAFASTTGTAATYLHINPSTPTQVEGGGTPISSVTTDFDGDTRNATTPDLGADEGTFTPQDLSGPTISYTALGSTPSTANRTLVVTISDPSGVATGTNAPRLYYRKGTTGAYVFVNATSVSGSTYTFTFDYSLIGGVAGFDVVQYYVAAQDVPGNASTSPLGGSGATPPGTTAPTAPNQFLIQGILAGTYYVGTSTSPDPTRTYATLTAAVAAYNANTLGGAVTFVLLDATYSTAETFPIVVNANADASATNTLTIKPSAGVTPVVTGSVVTGAVLKLNGADYVTIDGSNNGTTTQDLTLTNTSATGTGNAVLWIAAASASDGANFNTIKNTKITGNSAAGFPQFTAFLGGGGAGVTAPTTSTPAPNSNNTLTNNALAKGFYGLFVYGTSATNPDQNNAIVGNQIGQNVSGFGFGLEGLRAVSQQNLLVQGNEIQNVVSADAFSHLGMNLSALKTSTITRNSIHNVQSNSASSGNVGYGILLASTAFNTSTNASANTISNNIIYNIAAPLAATSSNPNVLGIANNGGYGDKLYFNTVLLNAAQTAGTGYSAAISNGDSQFSTATSAIDVRNNIIAITANVTTAAKYFGYYTSAANVNGSTLNYNDYYIAGTGAATFAVGNLNGTTLASSATLAAWRTATGQEANSVSVNPNFAQTTTVPFDLTPTSATLNNLGDATTGVTVDFTGATRSATPDMGAYEFTPAPIDITPTVLVGPAAAGCYGATEALTVTISNNATAALNLALNPVTITVVVTPPSGPAQTFTTTVNTGTLAAGASQNVTLPGTLNLTAAGTYSFVITTSTPGDGTPGNDQLTVTRTVVGAAAQPQLVTFTGYTGANLTAVFPGWYEATGAAVPTGTTSAWTSQTGFGSTGNTTARINLYTTGKNDWIVSPKFLATASTVLTFDAGLSDFAALTADPAGMTGTDDFMEVRISTDCGQTFVRIPTFAQFNAGNQPSNGSLTNYSIDLSSYAGQQIILGFFASEGTVDDTPDYDFHLDNISVRSPLAIDLAPVALATPTATQGCYSAAETVSVTVSNLGSQSLNFATNPATVTAVVTTPGGSQTLTTTVSTGTLAPNATQTVSLAPTLDMSVLGTYSFAITATVQGDLVTSNDALAAVTRTAAAPVAGTLSSTSSALCVSGTTALTLTGAANGNIQYQSSSDNVTFTDIAGATAATYTTPVLTATTYYRALVRCGTNVATSNVSTIAVSNPLVATTNTPLTICAGSTATLTATASTGANVRFFSAATGGTALTSTTPGSYTTPALTANTTYYAEAFTGGTESVGPTAQSSTGLTPQTGGALYFTTTRALTISAVTVFLNAGQAAGTVTIALRTGSSTGGAIVNSQSVAFAVPAGPATGVASYVVPLNYSVPAAGQYTLHLSSATQSGLLRDDAGANPTGYPYTSPSGALSITAPSVSSYYYYFYNWQISTVCAGATRTAIQVNVTQPATASFAAATASSCGTSPFALSGAVGGSATGGTYTSSGTGTFLPNATTLNATYTPSAADIAAGSVTLTLTTSGSAPCPDVTATQTLSISPAPVAAFSYPAGTTYCAGSTSTVAPTLGSGASAGTFASTTGLTVDATTGVINLATSAAGTYTVTNTIAASGPCAATTASTQVTVTPQTTASFSYPAGTLYCTSGTTNPAPSVTGTAGGTFASAPGLSLNASTGTITLASSTPGTYTVSYTVAGPCGSAATQTITVTGAPLATFAYPAGTTYCAGAASTVAPTLGSGASAGTFSSTAGLSLNASTGVIDLATSVAGTYTVTNTIAAANGCVAVTATGTVTVTPQTSAAFAYAGGTFCQSGVNPTPTITGTAGGTFTVTPSTGLSVNATTGTITLATSTLGTYTVSYTVAGPCGSTATQTITVTGAPLATFAYPAGTTYCAGAASTVAPTLGSGASAGTFSSTAGLSLNASTGVIDLATSVAGTYTVTNTIAASGSCAPATATASVTVTPATSAAFSYGGTSFCVSGTTAPVATVTGTSGGTFSSTTGLTLNATTGAITLASSTPGTYTVTYTVTGACGSSATVPVTIIAAPVAAFSYGTAATYCVSGTTNPAVVLGAGASAGTFSSTTGLTINATTGAITLASSTPGTYTVTNTLVAANGCAAVTATSTVTITAAPVASFSYGSAATYCVSGTTNPSVVLGAGASAGTFSANLTGLSLNAATGTITLASSTPGTYTVTNTVAAANGCAAVTATSTVTITAAPVAAFTYPATTICAGQTATVTPTLGAGATAGTFTSTTGLTINATTGVISPSTSTAGTYTVTNTIAAANGCAVVTSTQSVTILPVAVATFSYGASATYCVSGTTNPSVVLGAGASAGTFSSTTGLT